MPTRLADQSLQPERASDRTLSAVRAACSGAVLTVCSLFGGLLAGVILGNLVFGALPSHMNDPLRITFAATLALAGLLIGSALWGVLMGRFVGAPNSRRLAWAGMLGFVPITIVLGIALQLLEPIALARVGEQIPLHRLFTLLFVPTAFLIAAAGGLALGVGLRNTRLAWRLALRTGVAAALAFLIVNLLLELIGWQVGGPGAAERFTMLTVLLISDLGAALAGGATLGVALAHTPPR